MFRALCVSLDCCRRRFGVGLQGLMQPAPVSSEVCLSRRLCLGVIPCKLTFACTPGCKIQMSVVRDFETGGGLNQERVWRIMVDVTRLVCGEATDGFGWYAACGSTPPRTLL